MAEVGTVDEYCAISRHDQLVFADAVIKIAAVCGARDIRDTRALVKCRCCTCCRCRRACPVICIRHLRHVKVSQRKLLCGRPYYARYALCLVPYAELYATCATST